ncbi:MAG: hypothetical protein M3Z31_08540 [Pseudomonadota bacterium]|nr:hypothetical protein [Pseudomonadota bacterium]
MSAGGAVVTQSCRFSDATTGQSIVTTVSLSGLSAEDDAQTKPLLILQVPQGASGFVATYDNGRGTRGRLLVTSGVSVLPVDSRSSLVAEPGMQLVLLELPGGAPADTYAMTLTYATGSTALKALVASKVTASGTTYYAPIVACSTTGGLQAVPFVPLAGAPEPSVIQAESLAGAYADCTGKQYTYTSAPPRTTVAEVVEFYNASLDHYFITWIGSEITVLDSGQVRGWQRTGYTLRTYTTAEAGTSPVCRYYLPPAFGDSHFFGRGERECTDTGARNPGFVLEDAGFMFMSLPSLGLCATATRPVYRLYSNRADANHRYTTDPAVRDAMVARGWLAEGDGPDRVVMCAPA